MKIKGNIQSNYSSKIAGYLTDIGNPDVYEVICKPEVLALSAGLTVVFKAANTNTGASTLSVDSLVAKDIKKNVSVVLSAGDILVGQVVTCVYDGTNFQLLAGYSGYSGAVGTSGYSGFSGTSGYSGFSGDSAANSGYSGFSGKSGYSGYSGLSGYSGYSGISGHSGFSGVSGYSGFSGLSGYSGAPLGYNVYTALLTQTGTNAPVATVLQNTLGGTVVWARPSPSNFTATLSGAFTDQKTWPIANNTKIDEAFIIITRFSNDVIQMAFADDFTDVGVEIRVYP